MERTLTAGTVGKVGESVLLQGWVNSRRDHGKIMFLDIRDRTGEVVQVVSTKAMGDARPEDVVEIEGVVHKRPDSMVNPKIATGTVEVEASKVTILSKSHELPFPLDTDGYDIKEDVRLKYRYLDLRRARLQRNIKLRSKLVDAIRQYLFSHDFTEIETPMLTKSTPEGSRDFLVPSRMQPGKFYALPQSPQQYKQLLMVAGFERYFQIARCMRDEDLRADRGFEHTQVDIEMSFVKREDVMALDEGMITTVLEGLGYKLKTKPFPVITYKEAMEKYGADKFDMRSEEDKKNGVLAFAWVVDFPFFEKDKEGNWTFTHNPFSMPKPEHRQWLLEKSHIGEILTTQYDLVCNGYETGGGSIRSHEPEILKTVFEILGHPPEKIREQFGHMLDAFSYGAPPHGGLAHGIERLMMIMTGEPYLREVVAFPQTAGGTASVMDAPSDVDPKQLSELGLSVDKLKGGEAVYDAIVAEFSKANVTFDAYEHREVKTSEEAAAIRNTPLSWGAKAMLMYADGKPVMVVVAADTKVDLPAFKHAYGIKDLRMATPEEVERVTGTVIGAVPPFGHIFRIPLYLDKKVEANDRVVFNAGLRTKSIQLARADYERVAAPVVGEFSKGK
jgi:aspartyl-tRNA synthetase